MLGRRAETRSCPARRPPRPRALSHGRDLAAASGAGARPRVRPCGVLKQRRVLRARSGTDDPLRDLSSGSVASRKWVGTVVRVIVVTEHRWRDCTGSHRLPRGVGRGGTGVRKTRGEPRFTRLLQAPRAPCPLASGLPGISHVSLKGGVTSLCFRSCRAAREAEGTRGCPFSVRHRPAWVPPANRPQVRVETQAPEPGAFCGSTQEQGLQGVPESPTQVRGPGHATRPFPAPAKTPFLGLRRARLQAGSGLRGMTGQVFVCERHVVTAGRGRPGTSGDVPGTTHERDEPTTVPHFYVLVVKFHKSA